MAISWLLGEHNNLETTVTQTLFAKGNEFETVNKQSVSDCYVIVVFFPLIWRISVVPAEQVFNSLDNRLTKDFFK